MKQLSAKISSASVTPSSNLKKKWSFQQFQALSWQELHLSKVFANLSMQDTMILTIIGFTFDRLNKSDAVSHAWRIHLFWTRGWYHHQALLVVDHQIGLSQLVRDFGVVEFRNSILAHAALGKLFDLPTILTTSADTGMYNVPLNGDLWTLTISRTKWCFAKGNYWGEKWLHGR